MHWRWNYTLLASRVPYKCTQMESVEVAEDVATTASRNTSPSLPEDAHLFEADTVAGLSKTGVGEIPVTVSTGE